MPHRPELGSFPMILRDFTTPDPRTGELLLDYDNNDLYYVTQTGEIISIFRDIYNKIVAAKLQNNSIIIDDLDKQDPRPDVDEIWPPLEEREYNDIHMIVVSRRDRTDEKSNPLTAPTWAVVSGKTFLGKNSGYNQNYEE